MRITISDETRELYKQIKKARLENERVARLELEVITLRRLVGSTREQRLAIARERGTHTDDEWHALLFICNFRCVRCGITSSECLEQTGKRLAKDHIISLCSTYSSDDIFNIQPLCGPCNSSKGTQYKHYLSMPIRHLLTQLIEFSIAFNSDDIPDIAHAIEEEEMRTLEYARWHRLNPPEKSDQCSDVGSVESIN